MEKTLYLHWGPGGNTQAELKSLSHLFSPHFIWWNQPTFDSKHPKPYLSLVEATLEQIHQISRETQAPVNLFGHSFGGQLALEAAKRMPEKVGRITLVAALPSVKAGYTHFGVHLANVYRDEAIRTAALDFEKSPSYETFVSLVQSVSQHPDFLNHYWGQNERSIAARNLFLKAAEAQPILNFETYMTVMKNLLDEFVTEEYVNQLTPSAETPVEIHLGNEDPYFDVDDAARKWQIRIPHARIFTHSAGHFVHLESGIVWT